jgi:signal peptidase I
MIVAATVAGTAGCSLHSTQAHGGKTVQMTQGGTSMEPTVKHGQVITAREVGSQYKPQHGDLVLFHPSGRWSAGDFPQTFLKRVVAVGGETIACCDKAGKVTINGTPQAEPYLGTNSPLDEPPNPSSCLPRRFGPVAVAAGTVFVMGDNRMYSSDSRCKGAIPVSSIYAVMGG